jgi:undecaprenyl-diphosphatase
MDYRIFRAINQFAGRNQLFDMIMVAISQKVRYLYLILLIFMWFRNNSYKKVTLYACVSVVVTILLNRLIKLFYFKPRPFLKFWVHLLPPAPSKKNSSFPSKHTTLAFAVATSVLLYKRLVGLIMFILAFLAGFSRIWMGQHFPSDIVGSAILGSLTSIIVYITKRVWNPFIDRIIHSYNGFFQ